MNGLMESAEELFRLNDLINEGAKASCEVLTNELSRLEAKDDFVSRIRVEDDALLVELADQIAGVLGHVAI